MLIIKRYLSFFCGILTLVFLEIFILEIFVVFPLGLLYVSALYVILLFVGLYYLQKNKLKSFGQKSAYFILPFIFIINVVLFVLYFNYDRGLLHILAFLAGMTIWVYIESFFLKYYFVNFYRFHSFENTSENIIITTAFLFFLNFFSSSVYFSLSYLKLLIIAGLVLFLLNWIQFVFNGILSQKSFLSYFKSLKTLHNNKALIYLISIPFLSLQILLVSIFLPTNFYSVALLNTVFMYIFMLFSRYALLEQLSLKMVQKYLSLSVIIIVFIFFISNWM